MKKNLWLIAALLLMSFAGIEKKKITIYLIGDSTMSIKSKTNYPETGWGMPFVNFWDSTVTVDNRAQNGRSTKSFLKEARWQPVVDKLQEGDYVFIQFGHNDEVPTKANATTPEEFAANLAKYVTDVRAKKAMPVLLTPVARRKFDSAGRAIDTHAQYAAIVRIVAQKENVLLIDLDKSSTDWLQKTGVETSKLYWNHLAPGEHPNYPAGNTDDTHFNELGARTMAELVLADIRNLPIELKDRIIKKPAKK